MPRPKEFDRDQVLDLATDFFWKRGYEATSIGDLVVALGIGRQSLYDTFGDKHALYLAALDRYRQRNGGAVARALDSDVPLRRAMRDLFEGVVDQLLGDPQGKSCMLVSAVAARCPDDTEVAERFCANLQGMEQTLQRRFLRAQQEGEIARHLEPVALARYFVNTLNGLQITGKAIRDRRALLEIVDVALAVLG
jgi:TetR/AcrR family transcriptional regulator, transcriptional repressor for nem operon